MTLPETLEEMLEVTIGELLAVMEANNASHYTGVFEEGEVKLTLAVVGGTNYAKLAAFVQGLMRDYPRQPAGLEV